MDQRRLISGFASAFAVLFMVFAAARARADRVVAPPRIESARGVALGSGVRAAAASTQAQAENPANLVLGGLYHIESFLAYDPTFRRLSVGGAVVDSMTSRLAAGLSMRGLFGKNGAGENSGWEGRLGLGFPIVDAISIGLAGRYSNLKVSDPRAIPEHIVTDPATMMITRVDRTYQLKAFTMDAAITVRPVAGLAIAALAYNLIQTDTPLAPLMVGGSAAFMSSGLTLGADVLVDLNTHDAFESPKLLVGGGAEYLIQGLVPLRVGYLYDQGREQNFVTGGLGYVDPRLGAQISLRQGVSGGSETSLFLALQYFVR